MPLEQLASRERRGCKEPKSKSHRAEEQRQRELVPPTGDDDHKLTGNHYYPSPYGCRTGFLKIDAVVASKGLMRH